MVVLKSDNLGVVYQKVAGKRSLMVPIYMLLWCSIRLVLGEASLICGTGIIGV